MGNNNIKVRFAPSPTGYLHIGGLRTALYNYLFAKKNNAKIVLRIEDTDRNRFVDGAVNNLMETLSWAGLNFDEGPSSEGSAGPYFQSQRIDLYKKYATELINNKKAYYAFDTPERLKELREWQEKNKQPYKYDKLALSLSEKETNEKLDSGEPYVVRLNVPPGKQVVVDDAIRGKVAFETNIVDDQVLLKSDGYPTYHLANVVDDHLMGITHVIRGEEWLSSTPKHILLYDFLGWEKPVFAHLPLLLNPDKSKLSKRQGDVAVEDYIKKGYLKEALINFVALLGWNPGDEQEFFTMQELAEKFSLERVHKSGAVFNIEKLNWLNAEHLRGKPDVELLIMLKEEISKSDLQNKNYDDKYLTAIINAMKPRVSFISEFISKCPYFYNTPAEYDEKVVKKRWKEDSGELLKNLASKFSSLTNPSNENYEEALKTTAEQLNTGIGKLIHPLRIAVSGTGEGPGVYEIVEIIGREETLKRINKAIETLK